MGCVVGCMGACGVRRGRVGCVVGVAVGAGCWGGVLGREVGVVSGLPRMPRIKLAPLYHPDTLVNPDTFETS